MSGVMKYRGYSGTIEYDADEEVFVGRVLGLTSVLMFEGESVSELKKDFADAVDDYIEIRKEMGLEPEKPFSGKFTVRVSPEIHAQVAIRAKNAGKSLNAFVTETLVNAMR